MVASLVYRVSSRTARAKQRNPVSKKTKTNKQTKCRTARVCNPQYREAEAEDLRRLLSRPPSIPGECQA